MELYAIPVVAEARQWLFRLPLRERERALAIGHARARAQFVVGRLAVRALLGERLGLPLAEVDLRTGPAGAPELAGADWNFNISHAGNWAVVALCRGLPVGIDIESLRPFADALQVARQHLHRDEQAWLLSIPAACRSTAFLRLWVCKEAVIKAARRGLWIGWMTGWPCRRHPMASRSRSSTVTCGHGAFILSTYARATLAPSPRVQRRMSLRLRGSRSRR